MNQSNQSKQVLLSVIGVAILVVAVVGVSFAFFNYTRTGSANTVTTGTIKFNSTQSQLNVTNVFPVAKSAAENASASSPNASVALSTVTITGNTTYADGLDFRVTARSVDFGSVPVSVLVETTGNLTEVDSAAAAATGDSIYVAQYENGALATAGTAPVLATGHIANGTTANQTITVKAFIDDAKVYITDTPVDGPYDPEQPAETGYAASGNPNASNGTTVPSGKTAVTTTVWNRLAQNPATFLIRVESRETTTGSYMD